MLKHIFKLTVLSYILEMLGIVFIAKYHVSELVELGLKLDQN